MQHIHLPVTYHNNQSKIFFESNARFKICAKGRRFGLTRGMAQLAIETMLEGKGPILWVDTVNGNLDRYMDRYFKPVLRHLAKGMWQYRQQRKELTVGEQKMDLRSADRPENLEGFGYQLIILNEAGIILKNRYLWENAIRPMAMDFKADVLIGGTPKGKKVGTEKHLFYELYEKAKKDKTGTWQAFNFSSYDNAFLDPAEVDELVSETSASVRDQEIFGKFIDSVGSGIIKREWFKYYTELPPVVFRIIQSWDTAFKKNQENDFSVCTTWAETPFGYYLLDLFIERIEFPTLKRVAVQLYDKWRPAAVLVEDKASGQSLIQELQTTIIPVIPVPVAVDKVARAHGNAPTFESGKVFLPEGFEWVSDLVDEMVDFPGVEHDDRNDSTHQAINYMKTTASGLDLQSMGRQGASSILNGF